MTAEPHELTLRPITGRAELDLFCRFPYVLDEELAGDLDAGRRRPEWLWLALRGERVVARAAWWARRPGDAPLLLDVFDIDHSADRVSIGARLVAAARSAVVAAGAQPPEYLRFVPTDWRGRPSVRKAVEDRMAALERTGARLFTERLRLQWRAGTAVPEPTGRLGFRPVDGPGELITLMTRVLDGTLDAHSRADLARMPAEQAAAEHYDSELANCPSPRDWWRTATLPDGEPVGFVLPVHNGYNPIIAYLGVLPEHRGNGYIDEILAEGTRILATRHVERIRADADLDNVPMTRAFQRAGYVNFARTICMAWS